jgi:hypothetical protein
MQILIAFSAKKPATCVQNHEPQAFHDACELARTRRFFVRIIIPVADSMAMTIIVMHTSKISISFPNKSSGKKKHPSTARGRRDGCEGRNDS